MNNLSLAQVMLNYFKIGGKKLTLITFTKSVTNYFSKKGKFLNWVMTEKHLLTGY